MELKSNFALFLINCIYFETNCCYFNFKYYEFILDSHRPQGHFDFTRVKAKKK